MRSPRFLAIGVIAALALSLSACAQHVTREDLEESIADVRSQVEGQKERIEENRSAIQQLRESQNELQKSLERLRQDFDARIQELEDRLVLALPVHFEFDRARVRPVDEPLLDRFAATVRKHMPRGVITVEGFADRAGSDAYNRELARERAEAVRSYLVENADLSADRVRAVGYGENRLVNEQTGPGRSGIENRRATLVVEFSGRVGS